MPFITNEAQWPTHFNTDAKEQVFLLKALATIAQRQGFADWHRMSAIANPCRFTVPGPLPAMSDATHEDLFAVHRILQVNRRDYLPDLYRDSSDAPLLPEISPQQWAFVSDLLEHAPFYDKDAYGHFLKFARSLHEKLATGRIAASLRKVEGGALTPLPPHAWNTGFAKVELKFFFGEMNGDERCWFSNLGQGDSHIFLDRKELDKVFMPGRDRREDAVQALRAADEHGRMGGETSSEVYDRIRRQFGLTQGRMNEVIKRFKEQTPSPKWLGKGGRPKNAGNDR